jgi:hypothetical protein
VKAYRTSIAILSAVFILLGFGLLIHTAFLGGGIGLVIGALFIALGTGRLWLLRTKK